MSILPDISNREKLNCELDIRLNYVWTLIDQAGGLDNLTHNQLATILRVAYTAGYQDALTEPSAGQLLADVPGFKIRGRKR